MTTNNNSEYFKLGEFIASLMLKGFIHPDLRLNNIGIDENTGKIKILDFGLPLPLEEKIKFKKINEISDIIQAYQRVYIRPNHSSSEVYYTDDGENFHLVEDANGNVVDGEKDGAYAKANAILEENIKNYTKTIPDDLSEDTVKRLTKMLFPPLNDLDSFSKKSYFHAGFIAYGGLLGHAIFLNAANYNLSGLLSIISSPAQLSYDASFLYKYKNIAETIKEWKTCKSGTAVDFHSFDLDQEQTAFTKLTTSKNKIYQSIFLHIWHYVCEKSAEELFPKEITTKMRTDADLSIFNISKSYYDLGYKCTAYGCFKKYILNQNSDSCFKPRINKDTIDFINGIVDKYDLIELLWILNDLDQLAGGNINNLHSKR